MTARRIAVVAPSSRLSPEVIDQVHSLARATFGEAAPQIVFHPQCLASAGHFAGDDEVRAAAFIEVANDPAYDAVWFARGGYGSGRLAELVTPRLSEAARAKAYLGYSDAGALMGALYAAGFSGLAHGPMPQDIARAGGETAVTRALAWLMDRDPGALEPSLAPGMKAAAFNLATFSSIVGTPMQPDLSGHVLMLEDVSEHLYRIDRFFLHVTSNPDVRRAAGIRLGRVSDVTPNDPPFAGDAVAIARFWCDRSGIPYLGRADIGHDVENKVVPFGSCPS